MTDDRPSPPPGPRYREYAPAPDLRAYVACTWDSVVGPHGRSGPSPIIPDGCVDRVVVGAAPPHVAGPATVTQWIPPFSPGTVIAGLRFRPGAARAVLRCSVDELRNRDAPLRDVCGGRATVPVGDVESTPSPAAKREALERWARARIERCGGVDLQLVTAATRLTRDPRQTVAALADQVGWDPRRLHREFTAACGYGPKLLQRIMRLQRAIRLSRQSAPPLPLPQLAVAAGYADQAHMTREFGSLTGFTPAVYLASVGAEVGRWLDEPG